MLIFENATFEQLLFLNILVFRFLSEVVDFDQGSARNEKYRSLLAHLDNLSSEDRRYAEAFPSIFLL